MSEENKHENSVSEAPEGAVAEGMHDAPKKGAAKAEPMQKAGDYEDLGPAVTSPTDEVAERPVNVRVTSACFPQVF